MNITSIAQTLSWALTEPLFSLMNPSERAAVDASFHADGAPITEPEAANCIVAFAAVTERVREMDAVTFSAAYGVHPLEGGPLLAKVLRLYTLCLSGASLETVKHARTEVA